MGTFTDYTGMTDVPENQCAKYARQMLGRLHAGGMMSVDEVGLFGCRIRLLYPPELDEAGRGGAQTPLNEHGYGLKNALSYLCEGVEVWLLESRTKEDAAADRYRCVSAPYAAIDRKMRAKVHQGNGATLHETGATIRVRCSKEKFESLMPATKRTKADFRQLCGYLEEELAYTYAAILAEGRITIGVICCEQNAPESYHQLEALEPLWEENPVELPETAKNAFVEGDRGDHPPPPDREGLHGLDVQWYLNLVCPQSVYHWQAGRTLPNIDNFYALSVLFGTTVNDLVAEQEGRSA